MRKFATRAVQAFAGGMLAALVVGWRTFDKGGLPWLDAAYIGVGCAVIAVLLQLAGGPVFAALRQRQAAAPVENKPNKPTENLIDRVKPLPKPETEEEDG